MNESQYIYLQKRQWRAITTDWEILSQYDNTNGKLYCLTDFQVGWLLSVTEYFRWSTRWENCPCTQADMDALKAEMDYNLMTCYDYQGWQLQAIYDNQAQQQFAQFNADWNGTQPSSVNPSAPDDFFNGDGSDERDEALCTALTLWCYSYCVEWSSKASIVLGLANFVTDFVAGIIGAGGIINTLAITDLVTPLQEQFDAVQNIEAVNQIICDWRDSIEGVAITPTNWTNAMQALSYTIYSDAWYVQQLMSADTQLLDNFLTFCNALGNAYDLAQINISICPCESFWSFSCDFEVEQCDFYPYQIPPPYDEEIGQYVALAGWSTTDVREGIANWARSTNPSIDFEDTYISTVEFTFDFTVGVWQAVSNVAVAVFGYRNGSLVFTATQSRFSTPNANGQSFLASPGQILDTIRVIVRPSTSTIGTGNLSGSALVTYITITGTGENPFD